MAARTCEVRKPESLKDILDLMSKVFMATQTRNQVYKAILDKIRPYISEGEASKFYDPSNTNDPTGYIPSLFTEINVVRGNLINNSGASEGYGNYQTMCSESGHPQHIQQAATAVINALPKLHATLNFMYFNGSTLTPSYKGGKWATLLCNQNGDKLGKWLTHTDSDGFLRPGFDVNKLGSTNGNKVAESIVQIVDRKTYKPLQQVLAATMFVTDTWEDAMLGHSMAFLYEFCVNATNDNWSAKIVPYPELESICETLKVNLNSFIGTTAQSISAVCESNSSLYQSLADVSVFAKYPEWLKKNLDGIATSLSSMSADAAKWNQTDIADAKTYGPFKYGFVFKSTNWETNVKTQVPQAISSFIAESRQGSLKSLLTSLSTPRPGVPVPRAEETPVSPAKHHEPEHPPKPGIGPAPVAPQLSPNGHEGSPSSLKGHGWHSDGSSAMDFPMMPWFLLCLFFIRKLL